MARRIRDHIPEMPPAGKVFSTGQQTVFETVESPPTPKGLQPFRKSFTCAPGRSHVHYGIAKDPPPPSIRFGHKENSNGTVRGCLSDPTAIGVAAVANEQAERVYASHKREPLGKTPSLYPIPEHKRGAAFGSVTHSSESAKDIMYGAQEQAVPTANGDGVGTAKSRNYDWASVNIDPTKHRFGRSTIAHETVSTAAAEPTKLVPLASQLKMKMPLDFSKFDRSLTPPQSVFVLSDVADSDEATLGQPVVRSATLRKLRESGQTPQPDPNRVFGIPTIRTDLPRPKYKKVATNNNYGDDVAAGGLLNPSLFTTQGLDAVHLDREVSAEDAKRIMQRVGVADGNHDRILQHATRDGDRITYANLRGALAAHGH